jgi:hypothetical protein
MAENLLIVLAAYCACGFLFALAFVLIGCKRIDPHAAHGSWGFRLLVIPGATALWPLLLRRWLGGVNEPPEQCDPHRRASSEAKERQ